MQIRDTLQLSTRVFKTNKLRTSLTILGIGVGIGTILFLVSLGFGLQRTILEQITTSDALLSLDIFSESSTMIELDEENLERIESIPEVVDVSPAVTIPAQIEIGDLSSGITVNSVKPSFFKLSGIEVKKGTLFTEEEASKIVISSATLKVFNISDYEEAISSVASLKLYLPKKKQEDEESMVEEIEEVSLINDFEIIGVIEDESSAYAYISLSDISHLSLPSFSRAKIKVSSQNEIENVREKVIKMGFSVSALSDTIEEANKIFQAVQVILSLFGAVALIVSAIGMFNTMTIALLERTQEIGIMKSLGASNKDVWKMFLFEAVIIGFLGGVSGIFIGVIAGKISNLGINKLASSLGGEEVDLFYTPNEFVIIILAFSLVVGFLTGLYPARRASRLNPLDALRYK
jgi:putative ABC transport system permease protein